MYSGIINTFQGVAYEYGVEMTYPVPESISASILNVSSQVFMLYTQYICALYEQVLCTAMILGCSAMVKKGLALYVFWTLAGFVLLATTLQSTHINIPLMYCIPLLITLSVVVFIKPKFRRVEIDRPQSKESIINKLPENSIQ